MLVEAMILGAEDVRAEAEHGASAGDARRHVLGAERPAFALCQDATSGGCSAVATLDLLK